MTIRNKSVLISGGAGFIGSHLADRIIKKEPKNLNGGVKLAPSTIENYAHC